MGLQTLHPHPQTRPHVARPSYLHSGSVGHQEIGLGFQGLKPWSPNQVASLEAEKTLSGHAVVHILACGQRESIR